MKDLDADNKSIKSGKSGKSGKSLGKKKKRATGQKSTKNSDAFP